MNRYVAVPALSLVAVIIKRLIQDSSLKWGIIEQWWDPLNFVNTWVKGIFAIREIFSSSFEAIGRKKYPRCLKMLNNSRYKKGSFNAAYS